jgi:hypothetical protein
MPEASGTHSKQAAQPADPISIVLSQCATKVRPIYPVEIIIKPIGNSRFQISPDMIASIPWPPDLANALSIKPADIISWLRGARAPEPWANPCECIRVACILSAIDSIRHLREQAQLNKRRKRDAYDRASAAAAELRRVLPAIIKFEKGASSEVLETLFPQKAARLKDQVPHLFNLPNAQRQNDLEILLTKVEELNVPSPSRFLAGLLGDWKTDAVGLFRCYQTIVGPSGIARKGPAVRFIQAALQRLHGNNYLPAAIEQNIRRGRAKGGDHDILSTKILWS